MVSNPGGNSAGGEGGQLPACPACPARARPPCAGTRSRRGGVLAGKVLNAVQMPDAWYVSVGPDMYNARAVWCWRRRPAGRSLPARRFLGRGVSYCATCDGCLSASRWRWWIHRHRPAGGGVSPENRPPVTYFDCPKCLRIKRRPGGVRHLRRPDHIPAEGVFILRPTMALRSCSRGWRGGTGLCDGGPAYGHQPPRPVCRGLHRRSPSGLQGVTRDGADRRAECGGLGGGSGAPKNRAERTTSNLSV